MGFFIFLLFVSLIVGFAIFSSIISRQNREITSLRQTVSKLRRDFNNLYEQLNSSAANQAADHSESPDELLNAPAEGDSPDNTFNNAGAFTASPQPPQPLSPPSYPAAVQNNSGYRADYENRGYSPQPQSSGGYLYNQAGKSHSAAFDNSNDKTPGNTENWIGKNLLGIAASVLIFVGLIFLGVLIYNHITDEIKITLMFAISGVLTALGIGLGAKKKNPFTLALTGCGAGAFFISIMITHVYFERIIDIVAFSLLLVWTALVLYIAKRFDSVSLSVVAHIGMIFSICFAYALGLSDEKLGLLVVYQLLSIAIIVVGNILCCKKTYRFGLFVSLVLTLVSSVFMWFRFQPPHNPLVSFYEIFPRTNLSTTVISLTFVAQFICAAFLSYLLSISTTRLESDDKKTTIHIFNKLLWIAAFFLNIFQLIYRLVLSGTIKFELSVFSANYSALFLAVLVGCLMAIIHAAITILLSLKLNFSSKLETISVFMMGGLISVLMVILWLNFFDTSNNLPHIPYLIIPAILFFVARLFSKNKKYSVGANIVLGIDFLFMLTSGYSSMEKAFALSSPIFYMVLYLLLIWGQWYFSDSETRQRYSLTARTLSLLLVELSLIVILLSSSYQHKHHILFLILTGLIALLNIVKYAGRGDKNGLHSLLLANEVVLILINSFIIAFLNATEITNILSLVIFFLTFTLAFSRIDRIIKKQSFQADETFMGIKLTLLVIALVQGNTAWFKQAYIFSLVCMLTALLCVIGGFLIKSKSLRLYGLVLTLFCVLKLVTYDVSGLNTILRVITLIGGGLICFIISAIYSYTVKYFKSDDDQQSQVKDEIPENINQP